MVKFLLKNLFLLPPAPNDAVLQGPHSQLNLERKQGRIQGGDFQVQLPLTPHPRLSKRKLKREKE